MKKNFYSINKEFSTNKIISTIYPDIPFLRNEAYSTNLILKNDKNRKGEGGLRTKKLYKHSYEFNNEDVFFINGTQNYKNKIQIQLDKKLIEYIFNYFLNNNLNLKFKNINYKKNIPYINSKLYDFRNQVDLIKEASELTNRKELKINFGKRIKLPLISIVTVVLNNEEGIEKTIESVLDQEYPNVEYIIIDGCSTDNTLSIIQKYEDQLDYWVSEYDHGIYDAMNKGIQLATGQYIGILNSGDVYTKNTLNIVHNIINKIDADFLSGAIHVVSSSDCVVEMPYFYLNYKSLLSTPFPHPACFVSLGLYKSIGLYDTNLKFAADHDFMVRSVRSNINIALSDFVLVNYLKEGKAYHSSTITKIKEKIFIIKKNKLGIIFYLLTFMWFVKFLLKKCYR